MTVDTLARGAPAEKNRLAALFALISLAALEPVASTASPAPGKRIKAGIIVSIGSGDGDQSKL
jgi:hypothetical protein